MERGTYPPPKLEKINALQSSTLFRMVDRYTLAHIADDLHLHTYHRFNIIFWQGDESDQLYFIQQGLVRIFRSSPEGEETTISVLASGHMIGEWLGEDQVGHVASAQVLSECSLWSISKQRFLHHMRQSEALMLATHRLLGEKMRLSTLYIEELVHRDIATRLLQIIQLYTAELGVTSRQSEVYELNLGLTQDDLAALVGASRETINRIFRMWSKEGLLEYKEGKLLLRDLTRLCHRQDAAEAQRALCSWQHALS